MTEAGTTSHPACDIDKLAIRYNELVAALTLSVEDPGAKDVADKLMHTRKAFFAACNDLHDELVELKQHLARRAAGALPPQLQQQPLQQQSAVQTDCMEVDNEQQPEQQAAAISQQHEAFLRGLQPLSAAVAGGAAAFGGVTR